MDRELVAVLFGALVGGLASLEGSVIVNRMQLRRTIRIRIYDELLPRLRQAYTGTATELLFGAYDFPYGALPEWFIPTVRDVYRSSVVSASKDRRMAERLQSVTLHREKVYWQGLQSGQSGEEMPGGGPDWKGDPDMLSEAERQVVLALDDYDRHLVKELGGAGLLMENWRWHLSSQSKIGWRRVQRRFGHDGRRSRNQHDIRK